ncbi:inner-membrane translocator [Thermodesulfatator indicus DSM 15286]|uniref:Inner-membrane translocator n=1 Tax=Thermodesulfatator indicus (strain DSM 15286 / JCM 11887 / CIR29812) TaxID=667014 RepID=F8ADY6_THEID|nr:branched-chain amino acid ABC transporter permease [Thermodesulfatator indicus]AEH44951.1 inner-membrane translocator [Thermodesulfatator indicus DSM 15286]
MRSFLVLYLIIYLLPIFVKNPYYLNVLAFIGLYFLVALGLTIFIGFAGQISLGHGAFYAMGAYGSALSYFYLKLPPFFGTLLAIFVTSLVAGILGRFVLRLKGHYLVMATLALNLIVYISLCEAETITGGISGLPGIPPYCIGGFCFNTDKANYYLIWTIALTIFFFILRLLQGRLGRELKAIKSSEAAARALGLPVLRYKVWSFVFSAVLAALAGALYAHYLSFISPKTFDIFYSVEVVTIVLVGGMGSPWGALAGAAFLTPLPQILSIFEELKDIFYGLSLMLILIFYPQGLISILKTTTWKKFFLPKSLR